MSAFQLLKKSIKILLPPSLTNTQKGDFWQEMVLEVLKTEYPAWDFRTNTQTVNGEIDILCSLESGETIVVECKNEKKSISIRIINNLIGKSSGEGAKEAWLFYTSDAGKHIPARIDQNQGNVHEPRLKLFGPDEFINLLIKHKKVDLPQIKNLPLNRVSCATLLVFADAHQLLWAIEEVGSSGIPDKVVLLSALSKQKIDFGKLKSAIATAEAWQGAQIISDEELASEENVQRNSFEFSIANISQSNNLSEYHRPCRPEDFVGRKKIIQDFWETCQSIKDKTDAGTRIICFHGESGRGKSSLILKVVAEGKARKELKEHFYCYHIDVRSARVSQSGLFVAAALVKAMLSALDASFIDYQNKVEIESLEGSLLNGKLVSGFIEKLQEKNLYLVIFFDQFEEIFKNESLMNVYSSFEALAHEVAALRGPIILVFSWRTGISIPDSHRAKSLWDNLADKRMDIEVEALNFHESKELLEKIEIFYKASKIRLDKKFKSWLLKHCPGYPWLLRKICAGLVSNTFDSQDINSHISVRKVDIKRLFDKDISMLTSPNQLNCLEHIANFSPVSIPETAAQFGLPVVTNLEEQNLIVRSGLNYAIYWDIFKEYITDGTIPIIPHSYRPRNSIQTVVKFIEVFKVRESMCLNLQEIADSLQKSIATCESILWDAENFFGCIRQKNNMVCIPEEILRADHQYLASFLEKNLQDHVVILQINKQVKTGQVITRWMFSDIVENAYLMEHLDEDDDCSEADLINKRKSSKKDYSSRIISWVLFSGFLEKSRIANCLQRPETMGAERGDLSASRLSISHAVIPGQLDIFDIANS